MPLANKCSYEFDIKMGKGLSATGLAGMGVMCSAICAKILEGLVYKGFLDTQENTNLIHSEVLLKKKGRDPSFQVTRNGIWRHYMYVQMLATRIEPRISHVQ